MALCDACQAFRITGLETFRSSPFQENRMHQLGHFSDVVSREEHCQLCKLITTAFREGPVPPDASVGGRIQGCWAAVSTTDSPGAYLQIWLVPGIEADMIDITIRPVEDEPGSKLPGGGAGRLLKDSFIRPDLIQRWINLCETKHDCGNPDLLAAASTRPLPPGFMVIDVVENCLLVTSESCRFLALSYVWGDSVKFKTTSKNIDQLRQPGTLEAAEAQLNPTIRDAISLTRRLGERYLWVDSLCILQDDAPNSQDNISAMDSIYQRAVVVLIAAANSAIAEGLRGTSTPRSSKQYRGTILPGLDVLAIFGHSTFMDRTSYETRGWTFQEEHLSTRALIFVNDQVYFSCRSGMFSEEISEDSREQSSVINKTRVSRRLIREGVVPSILYFQAVQAYTSRFLTYPSDMLNAFQGVGNVIDKIMNCGSYGGLPASIFDVAVLWQPSGQAARRPGFPSWSWAGWTGPIHWQGDTLELASYGYFATQQQEEEHLTSWLQQRTWINWRRPIGNGGIGPVWTDSPSTLDKVPGTKTSRQHYYTRYGPTAVAESNPYSRGADTLLHEASDTMSFPFGEEHEDPQAGIELFLPKHPPAASTSLFLHTLTARFRLEYAPDAYIRYGSIDPVWEPNGRAIYLLLNRHGQTCGYVLLAGICEQQSKAIPGGDDQVHDFLMLSEANYQSNYGRPHSNHAPYEQKWGVGPIWDEFHAMMICHPEELEQQDPKAPMIAERVGLGRVLKEALKDSCDPGPVWRNIILV
ncbi:heterokaryon incompatibility protein-domain-containing protein [Xylariales sp. PMI_506]|nr:heterokaryon incompatibility protein-domain-containing protein [Xylariales sp. PMI_506]